MINMYSNKNGELIFPCSPNNSITNTRHKFDIAEDKLIWKLISKYKDTKFHDASVIILTVSQILDDESDTIDEHIEGYMGGYIDDILHHSEDLYWSLLHEVEQRLYIELMVNMVGDCKDGMPIW